jgi:hypothetical protein
MVPARLEERPKEKGSALEDQEKASMALKG